LYTKETFGSKSRIPNPTFIAMPRTAPSMTSATNSDFQLLNFVVKKRAIAVAGAIEACAKSERTAQLKKSFEPVLA
jgi:hypothetical protein